MRTHVPPKRRFSQEPHGVTSKTTAFFIVTATKTSNLTKNIEILVEFEFLMAVVMKSSVFWDIMKFIP
jgi:hypothetical protein